MKQAAGTDAAETLDRWFKDDISKKFKSHNPWTIFSYEIEPDRVLIVYGTIRDQAAQKEAAEHLQTEVVRRFANVWPPIKSDQEVTDDELSSHYLLLVGHKFTNRISRPRALRNRPHSPSNSAVNLLKRRARRMLILTPGSSRPEKTPSIHDTRQSCSRVWMPHPLWRLGSQFTRCRKNQTHKSF